MPISLVLPQKTVLLTPLSYQLKTDLHNAVDERNKYKTHFEQTVGRHTVRLLVDLMNM